MKILLVNNHQYLLGGAEKYYLDLGKLLEKKGHEVAYFSTLDKKNIKTKWSKYFVKNIDTKGYSFGNFLKVVSGMFYSFESRKKIRLLLNEFKPDIVHFNNIYFRISPSVIFEIKKLGIPVIETVHDYHLLSPNVNLFHNGKVCEVSKGGRFYRNFFHKCVKDSYIISFLASASYYFHELTKVYGRVDHFIAPSRFLKNKLVSYGMPGSKITVLPNFVANKYRPKVKAGKYVLFLGVMLKHKGIYDLIDAARILPDIPFVFTGDGPEFNAIKRLISEKNIKNVKLTGRLEGKRLESVLTNSAFIVAPSLWYENLPYSVIESFGFAKPVVASDIGGIPEAVKDRYNGLLFKPGNIKELASKIEHLYKNKKLSERLGANAYKTFRQKYDPENYYSCVMDIYKKTVKLNSFK